MDEDLQIIEPKEYTGKKDEAYSHSALVMSALKHAKENRAKEMRDGYWNTKFDRFGNAHKVWIPDSRFEFIESVEALMMIQERDYDDKAREDIKRKREWLIERYKRYCELEEEEWKGMHQRIKMNHLRGGAYFRKGILSEALPWNFEYKRDKVEACTEIVSIIQNLIKRIGDYQEELYEA